MNSSMRETDTARRPLLLGFSTLIATVAMVLMIDQPQALASPVADPDYQVKLRIVETAVTENGLPTAYTSEVLGLNSNSEAETLVYADTGDRFYGNLGWTMRFKQEPNNPICTVTYKYRQQLSDNSLKKSVVETALEEARISNFDSSDNNYDPQINSSLYSSTLDFSNKKDSSCAEGLPQSQEIQDELVALEPGKLKKMSGTTIEQNSISLSAPVTQQSWSAQVRGIEADFEVTTIGDGYFVELSAKNGSRNDAIDIRDQLVLQLAYSGLLSPADAFKTNHALDGHL